MNAAQPSPDFWFCLRAQPKREHLAAVGLRKRFNIVCFAPRLRSRKLTRRGAVWFVEAMFPGYFFAQFDYQTERRRVEHSPGVSGILQFGDRLATIDAVTIADLRKHVRRTSGYVDPELGWRRSQIARGRIKVWRRWLLSYCRRRKEFACFWNYARALLAPGMEVSKETLIHTRSAAILNRRPLEPAR